MLRTPDRDTEPGFHGHARFATTGVSLGDRLASGASGAAVPIGGVALPERSGSTGPVSDYAALMTVPALVTRAD